MATPGFLSTLARHGAAPALLSEDGREVSYAELTRRGEAFAAQLGPDRTLVAIEAAPSAPAVAALVGALRAGHVVALLPPDAAARAAFVARFAPEHVWRPTDGRWRLERRGRSAEGALHPELALMLLTSGTTGGPRAVRLSGAALHANACAIAQFLGLGAADRAGLVLPLHYSYGLSVLTSHLAVGASVWLGAGSILGADFVGGLRARRCTGLAGVPYSYELLERVGFRAAVLPELRLMTVAGGRLAPERLRLYAAHMRETGGRFFAMYGQTEATARIAYLPPELAERRAECIGVAIPGGALGLVDEAGRELLGAGAPGELVYRGANVMMGYAEARSDLARGAELAALATGDVAVREPDGLFRIVGRKARMSKIAGLRISHDALETALAVEGVAAAVVGDDAELIAAFEGGGSEQRVRERLAAAARLPLNLVWAVAVPRLPRLASGKPDYAAIRELAGAARTERADPEIAGAFREAFHPRPVGPDDSFARLGGDSLRHVELALALERRLGHLPAGWETMRVAELSGRAGGSGRATAVDAGVGPDILLRAAAILLVVTYHATLWPISVGSMTMLVLVGFGLARFQLAALAEGGVGRFLRPLAAVLPPYYAILAGYALAWGQMPWASVFLVGNFGFADPVRYEMLPYLYWFVEVFAQLMIALAAAFLVAPVRRFALTAPFRFGLALLGVALVARAVVPVLWPLEGRQIFTLAWVLPMVAFGWCAAAATGRQRLLVLGLAAAAMPALAWAGGNWVGSWVRFGGQLPVIAALLYAPPVRLPAPATRAVLSIAAAGYAIYLVHRFAPEVLLAPLQASLPAGGFAALSVVAGVALGLLAHRALGSLKRLARGGAFTPKRRLRRSGAGA